MSDIEELMFDECPEMKRLRAELDSRGIEWWDDSEHVMHEKFNYIRVILRTKWEKLGEEVSVIWGYTHDDMGTMGISYGYPDKIECWWMADNSGPEPMTVEEILEEYA